MREFRVKLSLRNFLYLETFIETVPRFILQRNMLKTSNFLRKYSMNYSHNCLLNKKIIHANIVYLCTFVTYKYKCKVISFILNLRIIKSLYFTNMFLRYVCRYSNIKYHHFYFIIFNNSNCNKN